MTEPLLLALCAVLAVLVIGLAVALRRSYQRTARSSRRWNAGSTRSSGLGRPKRWGRRVSSTGASAPSSTNDGASAPSSTSVAGST